MACMARVLPAPDKPVKITNSILKTTFSAAKCHRKSHKFYLLSEMRRISGSSSTPVA